MACYAKNEEKAPTPHITTTANHLVLSYALERLHCKNIIIFFLSGQHLLHFILAPPAAEQPAVPVSA